MPRATTQFRISDKFKKTSCGPCTILTKDEEDQLEHWIVECAVVKGFQEDILLGFQEFCEKTNRTTPFTNNLPGKRLVSGIYEAASEYF